MKLLDKLQKALSDINDSLKKKYDFAGATAKNKNKKQRDIAQRAAQNEEILQDHPGAIEAKQKKLAGIQQDLKRRHLKLIKALEDMGKRESALLLKNWGEMDDTARKVDEELDKSNYGPKGMGLYDPAASIKRKQTRTGEVHEDAGQNKAVRQYTSALMGTAKDQAAAEARETKQRNKKQPVKVYTDEEKRALEEKYRKEGAIK